MSRASGDADEGAPDARRRALLDAAVTVFTRYGYRKTSMDEVARAAGLSRQGLYLHFPNKEELFRAGVKYTLEVGLAAASACLRDPERSLEAKLVGAFDAWVGRYVGTIGANAADLHEAATALIGPIIGEHEAMFVEAVAKVMTTSGLAAAYRPSGLTGRQLAETLDATARGLKYGSPSREAFGRSMTVAVRALCLPLVTRERAR